MFRRLTFAALAALSLLGCSEPPTKERDQAEGALAAARAADAAIYAPDEFRSAESALKEYDSFVAQHDYRQALQLALAARDNAYEAVKRAGNEKAQARSQAEALIAEVEMLIAAGQTRLNGTSRLSAQQVERLKNAVTTATSRLQEARSALGQQNYRGIVSMLTPVAESLRAEGITPGRR